MQLRRDKELEQIPAQPICVAGIILLKRHTVCHTLTSSHALNFIQVKPAFLTDIHFYGQGSRKRSLQNASQQKGSI